MSRVQKIPVALDFYRSTYFRDPSWFSEFKESFANDFSSSRMCFYLPYSCCSLVTEPHSCCYLSCLNLLTNWFKYVHWTCKKGRVVLNGPWISLWLGHGTSSWHSLFSFKPPVPEIELGGAWRGNGRISLCVFVSNTLIVCLYLWWGRSCSQNPFIWALGLWEMDPSCLQFLGSQTCMGATASVSAKRL